jgi:hypothetical protein
MQNIAAQAMALAKGFKYYLKKLMKEEMLGAIDVTMFEFHSKWLAKIIRVIIRCIRH